MSHYRDDLEAAHLRAQRAEDELRELAGIAERARVAEAEVLRLREKLGPQKPEASLAHVGLFVVFLLCGGVFAFFAMRASAIQSAAHRAEEAARDDAHEREMFAREQRARDREALERKREAQEAREAAERERAAAHQAAKAAGY